MTRGKQSFLGGAALLTVTMLVTKAIGALYKIPLGNLLDEQGMNYFYAAYNIYNLLLMVSTAGLPVALSKTISEANALNRRNQVDRVFRVGGAQAVAALAYGTESVPKVDKIVGPGNQFVAEAKKQVFGQVGIDMVAGPSEILVIADGKCNPQIVAADLLSQAEHDPNASAVLVTDSQELALAVQAAIEEQIPKLLRKDIARASIDNNGKIILAQSLDTAVEISNEIAPEHLEVCVDQPFDVLSKITNAGSVFLGRNCPEALGDYFAGPNHTLPTSGTARFSSPLSVDDFVKKMQYTYYTKDALAKAQMSVSNFAKKEGLTGHARSIDIRFDPAVVGEEP